MTNLRNKQRPEQGSVLVVTLVTVIILGITIASFLLMIQNENSLVVRSQAWNASLGMAEAGVEEALAQLNPGFTASTNIDRTANGWGNPSGGLYGPMTRTLSNGTYAVVYTTDTYPIIYSTGSVSVPYQSATLTRAVRVTTTNSPLFNLAMAALGSITMKGGGIATDSFNSSNPNLSTNGQYTPLRTSTNGNVASVYGPVSLGNHTIDGNLYLGPTAPFSSSSNQVNGTVYNDFNFNFPDVILPSLPWVPSLPAPQIINGTVYSHVFLFSGDYSVSDSGSIYVGTNADVVVHVTASNFKPGAIRVAGSYTNSGHLTVYMDGASATLSGNTTVDSGVAANFTYYGLPSNTSLTYGGTSSLVGTIYAPEANLTLNGGGSNVDLVGSTITKTVTMDGHYSFHFDEALLTNGPMRGYTATSWQEL